MTGTQQRNKVALVLASGGARGLAHIGVIRELEAHGFEITSIGGSSIGALVGGIYAAGTLDEFTDWMCSLDQVDVFDMMDFTLSGQGFIKGSRLFNFLKTFMGDKNIEDLRIPYIAVAADLITRKEVVFRTGKLSDAVRASIAIPSVITPVMLEDMILVDGGVVSPIPAEAVRRNPGDILVVCDINANIPYVKPEVPAKPEKIHEYSLKRKLFEFVRDNTHFFSPEARENGAPGYIEVINKTFDIMQDSICSLTKKNYNPEISVEISRDAASTFEFHRADELIESGRIAFRKALQESNLNQNS
jgi:NTE family protein